MQQENVSEQSGSRSVVGWLYWGSTPFNSKGHIMAVSEAHVFPGLLTPVLTQLPFQIHRLLFSHASAEVRGENTEDRKFASTKS